MATDEDGLAGVVRDLRAFTAARAWSQFHDPKNLAMAVASEAGELLAELRWVPNHEADAFAREAAHRSRIEAEVADVAITLLLFCDRVGIDLIAAVRAKMAANAERYPVEQFHGRW